VWNKILNSIVLVVFITRGHIPCFDPLQLNMQTVNGSRVSRRWNIYSITINFDDYTNLCQSLWTRSIRNNSVNMHTTRSIKTRSIVSSNCCTKLGQLQTTQFILCYIIYYIILMFQIKYRRYKLVQTRWVYLFIWLFIRTVYSVM
jgi:hypothetical protein